MIVRYNLYFWNPPVLTEAEEIEVGREIIATGGPVAWKKKAPYLPPHERHRVEAAVASGWNLSRLAIASAALLAIFGAIVTVGPRLWVPLSIACALILPFSIGTLLVARGRYHAWIDKVVAAHAASIKKAEESKAGSKDWTPRGVIKFVGGSLLLRVGQRSIITLDNESNEATSMFGNAHEMLEQLRRDAAHPLAPDELRDDWSTITNWLGGEANILAARNAAEELVAIRQHEMFARGFILYLREGRPPSPDLSDTFANFQLWLTALYPNPKSLNVILSPEVRAVFDRMHA